MTPWRSETMLALAAAAVAALALLLVTSEEVSATTWYVDDDGGANFKRIQDAIDVSENGDTIRVYEGTYHENVVVNKTVNLIGNGSEVTVIDGDGNGNRMLITSDWVNVSGFMMTGSGYYPDIGITLESSTNKITNNNFSNNWNGIYIWNSKNNTITNNNCSNNGWTGIYISNSKNNTITGNTCLHNYDGIHLDNANNNTLTDNICSNNTENGILLDVSNNNTITNNTCSGNDNYGIYLDFSNANTLSGNQMFEDGIFIDGFSLENWNTHFIDTTNRVNGKPVRYYKNTTGITVPSDAGQVILANSTQIVVENQNLSNGSVGILVGYSSNIRLSNNTCSNNTYNGIRLYYSDNNTLNNNTCSHNVYGINLGYSDNNTLTNNNCSDKNNDGIRLLMSNANTLVNNICSNNDNRGIYSYFSVNTTITNNTCWGNGDHGIYLYASSDENTLTNNNCSGNDRSGISLTRSAGNLLKNNSCENNGEDGIRLINSNNNTLTNNTCLNNRDYGTLLSNSNNNTLTNNICSNNDRSGIYLSSSNYNTLTNNTCSDNNWSGINLGYSDNNTLTNNTCSDNIRGFYLYNSDDNTFANNTISENNVGIYLKDSSEGNSANYNSIHNNTDYGIDASDNDGYTINATNNWWGDPSGPYHSDDNPEGNGDNVTDNVEFDPWLGKTENQPPTAYIDSISPNPAIEGETIFFSGEATDDGSIERYVWQSSIDNEIYNGTESTFNLSDLSPSTHTISFRVQDNDGTWSPWANTTLHINALPIAAIDSITPSPATDADVVTFNGSGTDPDGSVVGWQWRFDGGGVVSTEASFTWSGLLPGNHTISFRVQDNDGAWSPEVTAPLFINAVPTATIEGASPSPANEGEVVTLNGSGSDAGGSVIGYQWKSNLDGNLSMAANFTTTSISPGNHTISFRVQNDDGIWSDWVNTTLHINALPMASIDSIWPEIRKTGSRIVFSGTGLDSDGTIVRYEWDLDGDGTFERSGTAASANTTYASPGDYTVYLRVTDNEGATATAIATFHVQSPTNVAPVAKAGDDIRSRVGQAVSFHGTGVDLDGYILLFEWDFDGDGIFDSNSETDGEATFIYDQPGTFTAVFRVADDGGASSYDYRTVTILEPVDFTMRLEVPRLILDLGSGEGTMCDMLYITNHDRYTIEVLINITASGISVSPRSLSVTVKENETATVPVCMSRIEEITQRLFVVNITGAGKEIGTPHTPVLKAASFEVEILKADSTSDGKGIPFPSFSFVLAAGVIAALVRGRHNCKRR